MNKKIVIILLVVSILIGSLTTFYACDFLNGDIANLSTGLANNTSIVNLPIIMFAAVTICVPFYLLRLYKRPKTIKQLSKTYCVIIFVLSLIGLLGSIFSGLFVYHSFVKPYPFPGYLIITLIIHLGITIGVSLVYFLLIKRLKEDEETYKVTPKHVFYTIGMFLFAGFAYNRLGALLMAVFVVRSDVWLMALPLFLSLLIPLALLTRKAISILYKDKNLFIPILALTALNIVLFVTVIISTKDNTLIISAVSPVMPLERLVSLPLEIVMHFIINLSVSIVYIFIEKKGWKNNHSKEKENFVVDEP